MGELAAIGAVVLADVAAKTYLVIKVNTKVENNNLLRREFFKVKPPDFLGIPTLNFLDYT
jgi:hypothetical protein